MNHKWLGLGGMCALFLACQTQTPQAPETAAAAPNTNLAAEKAAEPVPAMAKPATEANVGTPTEQAKLVFAQRCVLCHGVNGKGDGITASSLNPRPRDYTDAAWQASVTDDYLHKIIVSGGDAMGKSMMMPPNPDLQDKTAVVDELVKIVRGFKK